MKIWTVYEMATASLGWYKNAGHMVEPGALVAPYILSFVTYPPYPSYILRCASGGVWATSLCRI